MTHVSSPYCPLALPQDSSIKFLICTDVAARGIDVKGLPLVINHTLPDVPETYIHRVGRTGRAGAVGMAVSLAGETSLERVWFHKCGSKKPAECGKTALLDEGGCTIWYDEASCLAQVEQRLQGITLPRASMETLRDGMTNLESLAAMSRPQVPPHVIKQMQYVAIVAPQARALGVLEAASQAMYYQSRDRSSRWRTMLQLGGGGGAAGAGVGAAAASAKHEQAGARAGSE